MRGKILFVVGLAAGYVLGARAGRPAYEALTERFGEARSNPTVHRVAEKAKSTLEEKAPAVADVAEKAASTVQDAAAAASEAGASGDDSPAESPGQEDRPQSDAKPADPEPADPKSADAQATDEKPADAATPGIEADGGTDAPAPARPSNRSKSGANAPKPSSPNPTAS